MCGIAGYYSLKNKLPEEHLRKIAASLEHRGPDAEGYFSDEIVSLASKRLRIIDLTPCSDQPVYSSDGRYVMVFNGEVYNYHEIASEIKSQTRDKITAFKPSSDSRVILEAFIQWGTSFIHKLNGMFAIAIYDTYEKNLLLFRDRIGIKPIYYYWDEVNFAFASELKALLQLPFIDKKIDYSTIAGYLHLGFIPAPKSIYSHINKMVPGTFVSIHKNHLTREQYWSPESVIRDEIIKDETQALVQLSELLKSSVLYQLNSDVPTGIFLSGGIDSTLITAKASNLSSVKVNTFSIGFADEEFSELLHARNISKHFGTNHHEFIVSPENALPMADAIFDVFDEPFADASSIPMLLLARMAKQSATVVLSGEGADELFMGYGAYRWAERLSNPFLQAARNPIAILLSRMGSRYKRAAKLFEFDHASALYNHIFSQEQYFFSLGELNGNILSPRMKERSDPHEPGFSFPSELLRRKRRLSASELQSLFDLKQYLPDDLLTQADRTSMHYSLEMRLPFLDHRLIEFALNLTPELKIKNGNSKYLLKKLLAQHIPKHLTDRPKQGFAVPLAKWFRKEWKNVIDETLSDTIIEKHGIVNKNAVKKLVNDFRDGDSYLFNRIWQLIVLHKWMEKNSGNSYFFAIDIERRVGEKAG